MNDMYQEARGPQGVTGQYGFKYRIMIGVSLFLLVANVMLVYQKKKSDLEREAQADTILLLEQEIKQLKQKVAGE